jgi:PAS domain S-box-containing protein
MIDRAAILILNVDDSDGARYAKTRVLRVAGFRVIEAKTGGDALEQAAAARPDLVLLDTKLPDLNGFEVCRRLKADPLTARSKVLQTSASFLKIEDKIHALNGGADNYLVEPIEPEELVANVDALLRARATESRLRDSEERFRQLAENINDVFWIFSPDGPQLLYVSPAYAGVWGGTADALRADPMAWLAQVHDDDRERVAASFAGLQRQAAYDEEYRIHVAGVGVGENGRNVERWVRDRGYPVLDEDNRFYRMVRISQDITVRKKAELKLLDGDRLKDEFLATLAHELRNPLGPIQSSVELLRLPGGVPAALAEKSLAMIARQTHHLVRLVDDLLDVSRITQGKVSIRAEPVELAEFIGAAVETVEPFLAGREHALSIDLPDEPLWLMGDAVRLSQIVANLLHNAGKYTPRGGAISLSAQKVGPAVQICVQDNGIGIAPAKIEHIFDLFAQADHADDRAQDGLGIGLSLVRELTLLHYGTAYASSAGTGKGSCFTLQLPLINRP